MFTHDALMRFFGLALCAQAGAAPQLESLWVFDPPTGAALAGGLNSVAQIGDVDGDGVPDVSLWGMGGSGAWVVSAAAGLPVLPPLICPGFDPGCRDVEHAGDWNGDGIDDVGLGFVEAGPGEIGEFQIFSGSNGALLFTLNNPLAPTFPHFGLGEPVGDLTGDSVPEFVFIWNTTFIDQRLALVVDGESGELLWIHRDLFAENACGIWPVGLADVTQDGVPEYALLSLKTGPPIGNSVTSRLSVYDGRLHVELYGRDFLRPSAAQNAGDFDGDGMPDIILSSEPGNCAPLFPGNDLPGRVLSGINLETLVELRFSRDPEFAYSCPLVAVESGGDFNGDGIPDLVASEPGVPGGAFPQAATVYSGRSGAMLYRLVDEIRGALVQDANADGLDDLLTVNPSTDLGTLHAGAPGDALRVCTSTVNSSGSAARLYTDGPISVNLNELNLLIEGGVPNELATFFCGPEIAQMPAGDGYLCVSPGATGFLRLSGPLMIDGDGVLLHRLDLSQGRIGSAGPFAWEVGSRWVVQAHIRDPLGPGGTGYTFTDALDITLVP